MFYKLQPVLGENDDLTAGSKVAKTNGYHSKNESETLTKRNGVAGSSNGHILNNGHDFEAKNTNGLNGFAGDYQARKRQ